MLQRTEIRGSPGQIFHEIEIHVDDPLGPVERPTGRTYRETTDGDDLGALLTEGKATPLYADIRGTIFGVLIEG